MKITKRQLRRIIKEEMQRSRPEQLIDRAVEIFAYDHEPSMSSNVSYPELSALADVAGANTSKRAIFDVMQDKLLTMGIDFDDDELMRFVGNL
ncbi:MAG: hypothetical protein CMA72_07155 [Euryarchaeota archaeon]|nr:hypothetical protein [Euryarchaeota archaeon]